ncbi:MAG TPA: MFS transporter [Stellaceae bacterium]|nr:MFS transporter [Stellaceae bacterium]
MSAGMAFFAGPQGHRLMAQQPSAASLLLTARGLRAFADGFVALLLPVYLTRLGFDALAIGMLTTATLLGSAALTLAVGLTAHRLAPRPLLLAASLLMLATGFCFALFGDFWPLVIVGFVGTLNPSAGDVSLFLPLEQALLAHGVADDKRTALFARYSLVGSLVGALGALAAGLPELISETLPVDGTVALQAMFVLYGLFGAAAFLLYRRLPPDAAATAGPAKQPLGPSRRIVFVLAALFSLDSFGGGFFVQSLLALWLFDRFGLSLTAAASFFFWSGVLTAFSYLVAVRIAGRIGLVNTMVFTHIPSSLCIIAVPFVPELGIVLALLLLRAALSQMDVPTRSSYVMAVVTPEERAAAASLTAVPRSLASAASPVLAGWLMTVSAFAWPFLIGGTLKIVYDLLLLAMFRGVKPREERVAAD